VAINIIDIGKQCVLREAKALEQIATFVDSKFELAVNTIFNSKGRLIISGIGKSAIIAQKIVATLNSTGTPSIFLHAADAIHGDLGMVQPNDVVMVISKSGESPEIKVLVPFIKNFGNTIIGMVGNENGYLAKHADIFLNTTVSQEACPNNLAPTSSTTAQLAMGDALAVCLMELNGFGTQDFAKFHPGGALGKKLYLKVGDLYIHNEKPSINSNATLQEVILSISKHRLGATVVVAEQKVLGIVTDGDLRRMLAKEISLQAINAASIMTANPTTIAADELAVEALDIMRKKNITQLVVADNNIYLGIIHLHDLIKEGLV
jgi:arabinose-5-phosphate isomerase